MDADRAYNGTSLALRGILATLFGVAAVFWPKMTLVTLVYLFSTYILLNGLIDLVFGIGRLANSNFSILSRILTLLFGILQIGVGVYLLRHPGVSFATLILLIGFTLVVRGVFEVIEGLFEEGPSFNRVMLIVMGLIAALAGIVVLFQPVASGVAFVWIIGLYALISGPLLIALSFEVNKMTKIPPVKRV